MNNIYNTRIPKIFLIKRRCSKIKKLALHIRKNFEKKCNKKRIDKFQKSSKIKKKKCGKTRGIDKFRN